MKKSYKFSREHRATNAEPYFSAISHFDITRSTKINTAMYKSQSPSTATQRNAVSSQLGGSFNICGTPIGFASRSRCEKRDEISQMKTRERENSVKMDSEPGATLRVKKLAQRFMQIKRGCQHSQKEKKKKKKCQLTLAFVSFVIYYT